MNYLFFCSELRNVGFNSYPRPQKQRSTSRTAIAIIWNIPLPKPPMTAKEQLLQEIETAEAWNHSPTPQLFTSNPSNQNKTTLLAIYRRTHRRYSPRSPRHPTHRRSRTTRSLSLWHTQTLTMKLIFADLKYRDTM
jgi:hypothetical protein